MRSSAAMVNAPHTFGVPLSNKCCLPWRLLLIGVWTALTAARAVSAPLAESAPPLDWSGYEFRVGQCLITAIHSNDEVINLEFTGRWSPVPGADIKWADVDKNALVIFRAKTLPEADWNLFRRLWDKLPRDKPVTLLTCAKGGYDIRGGVPSFSYPQDSFQVIQDGVTTDIPWKVRRR
jgi:hypothetical protein